MARERVVIIEAYNTKALEYRINEFLCVSDRSVISITPASIYIYISSECVVQHTVTILLK